MDVFVYGEVILFFGDVEILLGKKVYIK